MVGREIEVSFDELLRRPLTETFVTLTCVSDPVEGPYVGNARWLGASLASLIREARPRAGADQILSTSTDGFTCGTPVQTVLDGRDALLAVAMNGQPLPVEHGFPVPHGGAGPVRVRVGDQVGHRHQADHVRRRDGVLGAARLVAAGRDQDRVPDRRSRSTAPTKRAGRIAVAGVAWASTGASTRCTSGSTAGRGTRRRWRRYPASTPGGSGGGTGTPPRVRTSSRPGPPTAPATRRPASRLRRCRTGPAGTPRSRSRSTSGAVTASAGPRRYIVIRCTSVIGR